MKFIIPVFLLFFVASCSTTRNAAQKDQHLVNTEPTPTITPIESKKPLHIKGTITDSLGEPIEGALVQLIQDNQLVIQMETNAMGVYTFSGVPEGVYDLEVNYPGFETAYFCCIELSESKWVDFKLVRSDVPNVISLKPIIYLYPQDETDIHVQLNYKGELTHTYPKYPEDGWRVRAHPDGRLFDKNGKEYYALFWEGKPINPIIPTSGFVVAGNKTIEFLEEKLAELGLNRREANEFIMFWLPQMENNPFNLIHFSTDAYEELAELNVSPAPETVIRVMMIIKPLQREIDFPLQDISSLKMVRKGYCVVEWGGSFWPVVVN